MVEENNVVSILKYEGDKYISICNVEGKKQREKKNKNKNIKISAVQYVSSIYQRKVRILQTW